MSRPSRWLAAALLVGLGLGCTRAPKPRSAAAAPRIVSLSPALTEALFAVGCGDQLVGRDGWSDHPAAARAIPALPGLVPSAEAIVALRPTLVLSSFPPAALTGALDAAGVRWRGLSPARLPAIADSLAEVGALCGQRERGAAAAARFRRTLDELRRARPPGAPIPTYLELDPGAGRPHTVGGETFLDDGLAAIGARNVFAGAGRWIQVSAEQVLAAKPRLVVLTHKEPEAARRALTTRPGWGSLDATIVVVHPDLLSRPGPRLTEGLRRVAAAVHRAARTGAADHR